MSEKYRIRPYTADGIKEYDNPMPTWWLGLLYVTIAIAAGYLIRFHVLGAAGLLNEYETAEAAVTAAQERSAVAAAAVAAQTPLTERLKAADLIAAGKDVFLANCSPCHGQHAEGNIGPNLTDDYWLHGGRPEEIIRTITGGVAEKGMPPWGPVLGDKKVEAAAAYILSLHGSNPPNAKAPQGELFRPQHE